MLLQLLLLLLVVMVAVVAVLLVLITFRADDETRKPAAALALRPPACSYRDGALAKQLVRIDALGGKQACETLKVDRFFFSSVCRK